MAFLSYKEIVELIDKVAESGIGAVEIESSGTRVRIEGSIARDVSGNGSITVAGASPTEVTVVPASAPPSEPKPTVVAAPPAEAAEEEVDATWHIVTSPIVGTFYAAANPDSEPFARVGDRVAKGDVLCIIEAMKLMNEIESDSDGEIVKIFPKNAQPIEYGEKLFALKP